MEVLWQPWLGLEGSGNYGWSPVRISLTGSYGRL